jgi:hypothetical protein
LCLLPVGRWLSRKDNYFFGFSLKGFQKCFMKNQTI